MTGGPPPLPLIPSPGWLQGASGERKPDGGGDKGPGGSPGGSGATFTVPPELVVGLQKAWDATSPKAATPTWPSAASTWPTS